jgi:hypothetical protein
LSAYWTSVSCNRMHRAPSQKTSEISSFVSSFTDIPYIWYVEKLIDFWRKKGLCCPHVERDCLQIFIHALTLHHLLRAGSAYLPALYTLARGNLLCAVYKISASKTAITCIVWFKITVKFYFHLVGVCQIRISKDSIILDILQLFVSVSFPDDGGRGFRNIWILLRIDARDRPLYFDSL